LQHNSVFAEQKDIKQYLVLSRGESRVLGPDDLTDSSSAEQENQTHVQRPNHHLLPPRDEPNRTEQKSEEEEGLWQRTRVI